MRICMSPYRNVDFYHPCGDLNAVSECIAVSTKRNLLRSAALVLLSLPEKVEHLCYVNGISLESVRAIPLFHRGLPSFVLSLGKWQNYSDATCVSESGAVGQAARQNLCAAKAPWNLPAFGGGIPLEFIRRVTLRGILPSIKERQVEIMEGQISTQSKPIIDRKTFNLILAREGAEKAVEKASRFVTRAQIELWKLQFTQATKTARA